MRPASPSPEPLSRPPVSIRSAASWDLDFVQSLCRKVFLAYGSYDQYVAEWFTNDQVSSYLGELGGVRAGFCMIRMPPPPPPRQTGTVIAELLAIAVVPELQTQGVGKALLETCFAVARSSDPPARKMRLSVADGNARAQRMFAESGFRLERSSGIYPAGQRAQFMVKALKPMGREEGR